MLLHLQAGILGKAVGSAIAPPYLLCRSRAALWLAWAILGIASRPFGQDFFCFVAGKVTEVMSDADAEMFVDVPERPRNDIEVTVPSEECTDDASWADRVENGESHMDHGAQATYPFHLLSEVNAFDGVLPQNRLGELSESERLRLFRLNGVPSQPCTARFSLPDVSVDSNRIMEEVVSTGVERKFVKCIQRFRLGMVEVTFARKADCDLFLSKAAIPSSRRPSFFGRPARTSSIFVTIRDAPWELSDNLITDRLNQYGTVLSCRRAFNQALLPEKIHDGRRVVRMLLHRDIPCFMKFGPFLVRVFYPGKPKLCWKCASPDHIGRECPSQYCFNCEKKKMATLLTIVSIILNVLYANRRTTWQLTARQTGANEHWLREHWPEQKIQNQNQNQNRRLIWKRMRLLMNQQRPKTLKIHKIHKIKNPYPRTIRRAIHQRRRR